MKKFLFSFFLISLFLIWISPFFFAEATIQPRALELEYPPIQGFEPGTVEAGIPNYVKYIFNFLIWISGLIALGVLVYGGFRYLTSAGSPEKVKDAKDRILSALLGLVILFGSYLILVTVNPQLVQFNLGPLPPIRPQLKPGILLCKENMEKIKAFDNPENYPVDYLQTILDEIGEKCWYVSSSGPIDDPKFDNKTILACTIPGGTKKYGAILYDESNFTGTSQIIYTLDAQIHGFDIGKIKTSSVKNFIINDEPSSEWYVELFQLKDYNEADPEKKSKQYGKRDLAGLTECYDGLICDSGRSCDFPKESPWFGGNYYFQSVKIEGDLIVVFLKGIDCSATWGQNTETYVLVNSDSNLNDNRPMCNWCQYIPDRIPCAESMVILSAEIL